MTNKKKFMIGLSMMAAFAIILFAMFMPLIKGKNGLEYMDALYNAISKESAYYIPKVQAKGKTFIGTQIHMTLAMQDETTAEQTSKLFKKGDAAVLVSGSILRVSGDLGTILHTCLNDADAMYRNEGRKVAVKYGYDEKRALYNWWTACKMMADTLKSQKKFKAADFVEVVMKKAIEYSYNYYGIEGQKISERIGIVFLSLIFYVIYTLWYGYGIMYLFEGWGMQLDH